MTALFPASGTLKVDRSAITFGSDFDDTEQRLWWHRQTPEARIQHMLFLRKMNYGDESSARLQRVLEVAELPPIRIELMNEIDGVTFEDCRPRAIFAEFDGIQVPVIGLEDLKRNKLASGRPKDIDDLQQLP
jgi:hypothetical protein